jgi:hypothetical protein
MAIRIAAYLRYQCLEKNISELLLQKLLFILYGRNYGKLTWKLRVECTWNHLPFNIKILSNDMKHFKSTLKNYILENSIYSVEEFFFFQQTYQ